MNVRPPKWIDWLLTWYCNPDLLEEIQGDAYELYEERHARQGKTIADLNYLWDVIRFCRWSNVRRQRNDLRPGFLEVLLHLNFKIARRTATQNKLIFLIKVVGLAICLAFTTGLIAFVVGESTYDRHIRNYDSIYRIGSHVVSAGTESNYAVSPLALAESLIIETPEVESAARLMAAHRPQITVGDAHHYNIVTYSADSNFLTLLDFPIVHGSVDALELPDRMVLTESTAKTLFGNDDAVGKSLTFNDSQMEVGAVISDPSPRSHLDFDALISWNSFQHREHWDNFNAYTYVKVQEGVSREQLTKAVAALTADHLELVVADYELTYEPIVQRVDEIHLSPPMDEDLADRGQQSNLYILLTVTVLFLVTGVFNYLNITLAELTAAVRKFTILKIFGGVSADGYKVAITDALLSFTLVIPLGMAFCYFLLVTAQSQFGITLDAAVWSHPIMIAFLLGLPVLIIVSSCINVLFVSRSNDISRSLKGDVNVHSRGVSVRQYLVAAQLSFSVVMIALMIVIVDQFGFIENSDKGFSGEHIIVISPPKYDYDNEAEVLMESLRAIPGIDNVDGCSYTAGGRTETKEFFEVPLDGGMRKKLVNYMNMGYDFVDMLGIKLVQGRVFDRDREADATGSYLINETAAREFGWANPIGKNINGPLESDGREGEVIGVLKDFHYASLHNKIEPLIIFLNKNWGTEFIYVKLNPVRPADLLSRIEADYQKIFPNAPMNWSYLDSRYMALYREDRTIRNVFEVGLVVSLLLSSLGIFSISALLLVKRRKEMGIRKVVGASRAQLFALHLKTFLVFLGAATALAMPAIYLLADHWLKNFAYHVEFKVTYLLFPTVVALIIVLLATGIHAVKNSLVNPVDVLKQE